MKNSLYNTFYLGFLLLLPFVFYNKIIDPYLLPRQFFLALFILIIVIFLLKNKQNLKTSILKKPLFITMIVFILLNLISFFQSHVLSESHAVFSKIILTYFLFFITYILLENSFLQEKKIIKAIVFFGILSSFTALYQIYNKTVNGVHILYDISNISGNFGNKNLLSSLLFLCLPFYFIAKNFEKNIRYLSYFGISITLLIITIIRTRAVLIAVIIFFLLLLLFKIKERLLIKKRYFLITGFALVIFMGFLYKNLFWDKQQNEFSSSSNATKQYVLRVLDSQTLKSRILFWHNSIEMYKENLITGVGIGNWQINFPKYGLDKFEKSTKIINGESTLQRPHNDYLWILCETGTLALLSYLLIFGTILYQLYFLIKKSNSKKEKWNYFYLFSGIIGYLIVSFFDFPYERIEHQVIISLVFSIVCYSYYKTENTSKKIEVKWLSIIIILLCIYSITVSYFRLKGEYHALKMLHDKNDKNWFGTIAEAKKAENYFYKIDNTSIPLKWYEGIGNFNENQLLEAENCFVDAYQNNPYNIQVINNLASVFQANGKLDKAIKHYNEALKISKNFDEAKLNLAALYYNKKDFSKAFTLINEVDVNSTNPKYQTYLVPILNSKINTFLKLHSNKSQVTIIVKKVTTKEQLLELYFASKKAKLTFEDYLKIVKL